MINKNVLCQNFKALSAWMINELDNFKQLSSVYIGCKPKQIKENPRWLRRHRNYNLTLWDEQGLAVLLTVNAMFYQWLTHSKVPFNERKILKLIAPIFFGNNQEFISRLIDDSNIKKICYFFYLHLPDLLKLFDTKEDTAMWFLDWNLIAHSSDNTRQFFIKTDTLQQFKNSKCHFENVYVIVEKWNTPNSHGDTLGYDKIFFANKFEAAIYLSELVAKLNTPAQNALLKKADEIVDDIIRQYVPISCKQEPATKKIKPLKKPDTVVYILEFEKKLCKIGHSKDVLARAKTLATQGGRKILRIAYTKSFFKDKAQDIELICHDHFNKSRTNGEYFQITFDEACAYLSTHTPIVNTMPSRKRKE